MRVLSWNVNGLRAVLQKGLDPLAVVPAEVVVLQEIKARPEQLSPDWLASADWHMAWAPAERPGYSGVALCSRQAPEDLRVGLGEPVDVEGRTITAVFGPVAVVGAYFPNSQEGGRRLDYKLAYCAAMERHLETLRTEGLETECWGSNPTETM